MTTTTRREILTQAGLLAAGAVLGTHAEALGFRARYAPAAPVSLARCENYELPALLERMSKMMDQLGGLGAIANNKTVAVKVNLTGSAAGPVQGLSPARTYQVHPNVVLALSILLDKAGAKRIRIVEGSYTSQPIRELLGELGWNLSDFQKLHAPVEFEDTRYEGKVAPYVTVKVPGGGDLFPAYILNHSYVDCDSYVSIAKMKNHRDAGVTLAMKNNFGITPTALYGQGTKDEGSLSNRGSVIHAGTVRPPAGVPQELDPTTPRVAGYRVPRHVVDANGIRPIDLAFIDGIETVSGGEGPWWPELKPIQPHLLVAGKNAVCTDSIATVCMGYDPQAKSGTSTFPGDNHLELANRRGLGTNDPARIEVVGLSLAEARYPFVWTPPKS
jgi:uncharacterized protein (DUF362 family)